MSETSTTESQVVEPTATTTTAVLVVSTTGVFEWHSDADALIENSDWSHNPTMQHILRVLRRAHHAGLTDPQS